MKIYIQFCITSTIWLVSIKLVYLGLLLLLIFHITLKMVKTSFRLCDDDIIHLQRIMKIYIWFCITSTIWLVCMKRVYLGLFLLLICHITSNMVKPSYRLCDDDIIHLQRIMRIYIRFCITSTIWLLSIKLVYLGLFLLLICHIICKMVKPNYRLCDDDIIHLQRVMKIYIRFCITGTIWLVSVKLVYLGLFLLLICHITSKMVKPSYMLHDDDIIHLQRIMKIYIRFGITSTI